MMTRKSISALALSALLVGGAASCGSDSKTATKSSSTVAAKSTSTAPGSTVPKDSGITVSGAWARMSPAGVTMGAAYMDVASGMGDKLLGASVEPSIASKVEIHETVSADDDAPGTTKAPGMNSDEPMQGAMTMKPVESIDLPAGKTVSLKPGGYHIMLIGLAAPLEVGQSFQMTLKLEKHGDFMIDVKVKEG